MTDLAPATPDTCEVLVIGAGPAGSAAACTLALAGLDVVLADQHALGREKICGDGLIPDAHRALARLGLLDSVLAQATHVTHIGCVGPRGGRMEVPGTYSVLPRKTLDLLLNQAAQGAGARFVPHARFEAPLEDAAGRVVGAQLLVDGQPHTLRARWVVLATGAVPRALMAAGMCQRHTPSGVALRGYVHAPAMVGRIRSMDVVLGKALKPGYGWIFPAPGDCFNIGVGVVNSHHLQRGKGSKIDINLRAMFDAFCQHYAPAAELMQQGRLLGELKGAPLRCTLEGARWSRPGLLVTGEAAGSTYSCTGEGIGKAMETGMLAAQALLDGQHTDAGDYAGDGAGLRECYEQSLRALAPKFERWEQANRVNSMPWLVDLLIWRAHRSPRLLGRISRVLDESAYAGDLLSWRGVKRLVAG